MHCSSLCEADSEQIHGVCGVFRHWLIRDHESHDCRITQPSNCSFRRAVDHSAGDFYIQS